MGRDKERDATMRNKWYGFQAWLWYRHGKRLRRGVKGCVDYNCEPSQTHRRCTNCGGLTSGRTVRIESGTLRRRYAPFCISCDVRGAGNAAQQRLAKRRTEDDWDKQQLPDQYPGFSRQTLQAFAEGDNDYVATEVDAGVLNASINTLGLSDIMYAEERSRGSYLRRVATR